MQKLPMSVTLRAPSLVLAVSVGFVVAGCTGTKQASGESPAQTIVGVQTPVASSQVSTAPTVAGGHEHDSAVEGGGGHAASFDVPTERLPAVAEVAVLARVVAVDPAVLNTASGEWDPPAGASPDELHQLYSDLAPYTTVRIEVIELLGTRPTGVLEAKPGQTIEVTLLGGTKTFTLSEADAKAIGLTDPVEAEGSPPAGPIPTPGALTGPVEIKVSLRPAARLSQDDTVIAFLTKRPIHIYPGGVPKDVSVALVPEGWGFYHAEARAGAFKNAATGSDVAEEALRAAAAKLASQVGPPQAAGGSY